MAFTGLRLKQFKCFLDSEDVPLGPLTVIFGRNNTGKSSLLQSLLVLRQSLDAPEAFRLNLRGQIYKAGSYNDIVHQHKSKQHVTIALQVDGKTVSGNIEMEFSSSEPKSPKLVRLTVRSSGIDDVEFHTSQGGSYRLSIGGVDTGREKNANFFFPANSFLPRIGPNPLVLGRPNEKRKRARHNANSLILELERNLKGLRALSAFRHQPQRSYEFTGRSVHYESQGQGVIAALIEDSTRGRKKGRLLESVNRWLRQVGSVRLLPIRSISKTAKLFELRIRDTDSGRWANFADVGFGIGQALPVFVEGLETPKGGTFLVQEPEIHLHPDAQLGMADFLMSLVRSGRRVIVETHSENILLRIRHAVLNFRKKTNRNKPALDPNDLTVLIVSKATDGTSQVKVLEVDSLGQLDSWPKDFMEEATEERMAIMREMAKLAENS